MIYIRRAGIEDAELVSHISSEWFRATFDGTCTLEDMEMFLEEYFALPLVENELRDPSDYYFILEEDGQALAYVRIKAGTPPLLDTVLDREPMEIKRFYMDHRYKGKGIAQRLMDYSLEFIADQGFDTIVLSVWEYNVRAQQFYKSYGFRDTNIDNPFPVGNTPQTDKWYILKR